MIRDCLIARAAELYPQAIALDDGLAQIHYKEFDELTGITAQKLQQIGLKEGDRVAMYAAASPSFVITWMSLWRLGCVCVPLNTRHPLKAAQKLAEFVDCDWWYGDTTEETPTHFIQEGRACLRGTLFDDDTAVYHTACEGRRDEERSQRRASGQGRAADIIFTSGSTGTPKAVLHSLQNHIASAAGAAKNMPFGPGDRWLLSLPLYHVGGLSVLVRAALGGGTVVFLPSGVPLHEGLKREITHVSLVATQLYRLLQRPKELEEFRGHLKAILVGGGSTPGRLLEQAAALDLPLYTTYGMTETSAQLTTTRQGQGLEAWRTSGYVLPGRELRCTVEGELLVRGETLFQGYVDGARLETGRDGEGWFSTGDLGYIREDGALVVEGRKDNMFISGGENIQPEVIEAHINQLEGVIRSVVVPIEDQEFGARPVAFVELTEAHELRPDDFRRRLQEDLPGYQIPKHFQRWPPSEREQLKPDRKKFRELAARNIH